MKFTKEEALKEIKAMLGENPQISERSILEATETLIAFATEETELADFKEKAVPFFKTFEGNMRAEIAQRVKAVPPVKPAERSDTPPVPPTTTPADDEPVWFKAFREKSEQEIVALQNQLKDAETQKTVEQMRSTTIDKAKEIYTENVINAAMLNFDFAKDGANEAFITSCAEISKLFGVKPTTGGGGQPQKIDNSDFKEQLKQDGLIP